MCDKCNKLERANASLRAEVERLLAMVRRLEEEKDALEAAVKGGAADEEDAKLMRIRHGDQFLHVR